MEYVKMQGFSRRTWQDTYYDGQICFGEGFDEDIQETVRVNDYWGFNISSKNKGYIEDASDDWYLDLMNDRIERIR